MSDFDTLLLRETGIARLPDGSEAVNVGPIVAALGFLTEGRGEDRGMDEQGRPLPDLLSLAFDVVKSIILGGRHADYFHQVKLAFDEHAEAQGQMSLALAKQASAVRRSAAPVEPEPSRELAQVGLELRARLQKLQEAVAQVALEVDALDIGKPRRKSPRRKTKAKPKTKTKPSKTRRAKKRATKRR